MRQFWAFGVLVTALVGFTASANGLRVGGSQLLQLAEEVALGKIANRAVLSQRIGGTSTDAATLWAAIAAMKQSKTLPQTKEEWDAYRKHADSKKATGAEVLTWFDSASKNNTDLQTACKSKVLGQTVASTTETSYAVASPMQETPESVFRGFNPQIKENASFKEELLNTADSSRIETLGSLLQVVKAETAPILVPLTRKEYIQRAMEGVVSWGRRGFDKGKKPAYTFKYNLLTRFKNDTTATQSELAPEEAYVDGDSAAMAMDDMGEELTHCYWYNSPPSKN